MRKIMGRKSRGTERELRRTDDEEEHKKEGFTKGGVTFYRETNKHFSFFSLSS